MRFTTKHVVSSLATIMALAPGLAFSQWEVRPAPRSWNLPQATQTPPPTASMVAPQSLAQGRQFQGLDQSLGQYQSQPVASMNEAVTCSAALQLATMAAPNWARERGITPVTDAWLQKVFALGEIQGVTGDKVPELVQAEMQRQIDGAASDPAILSRRAFDCASRHP